jgi:hypothetical protein
MLGLMNMNAFWENQEMLLIFIRLRRGINFNLTTFIADFCVIVIFIIELTLIIPALAFPLEPDFNKKKLSKCCDHSKNIPLPQLKCQKYTTNMT